MSRSTTAPVQNPIGRSAEGLESGVARDRAARTNPHANHITEILPATARAFETTGIAEQGHVHPDTDQRGEGQCCHVVARKSRNHRLLPLRRADCREERVTEAKTLRKREQENHRRHHGSDMWIRIYRLDTAAESSGTRDDERETGEHEPDRAQRRQRVREHRGSARAEQHPHDEREDVPYAHFSGRFRATGETQSSDELYGVLSLPGS